MIKFKGKLNGNNVVKVPKITADHIVNIAEFRQSKKRTLQSDQVASETSSQGGLPA